MKKVGEFVLPLKIARRLSYGFLTLGVTGLVASILIFSLYIYYYSGFYISYESSIFINAIISASVFILVVSDLVVLYATYKLGEVTENKKILDGIKFLGISIALIFFFAPFAGLSSLISPTFIFVMPPLLGFTFIVAVISHLYILWGLMEYGEAEGSGVIVLISKILIVLFLLSPIITLVLSVAFGGVFFSEFLIVGGGLLSSFSIGIVILVLAIFLGWEFGKISEKIDNVVKTVNIEEISEIVKGKSLEDIRDISREKKLPFLLLASLKSRLK